MGVKLKPWDRRKGESSQAYEAFLAYRDMGVKRSIESLARDGGETGGKSRSSIALWSSRYGWVERCRAWDNHLQAERDRVALADARKWERRRLAELEEVHNDKESLREKGRRLLALPLTTQKTSKDGKTVIVQYKRGQLTEAVNALVKAAEMGAALGAATAKDPADMTDAELLGVESAYDDLGESAA